jgi:uncharacterized membrane protein
MVFIKEDLFALLAGLGVALIVQGERKRGAILLASSVAAFATVVGVIVPAFSDAGEYGYTGAYGELLLRPWEILPRLVTPAVKLETAALWFVPFALVSLASPLALLVIPLALTRFLSLVPTHWGTVFHYSAPLAPIVAMSAVDGLARIARHVRERRGEATARRVVAGVAAASVVLSALVPGRQPLWRVFAPRHYRTTDVDATGRMAVAMVPPGASVVAQAAIVPHLSMRDRIYVLDASAPEADYVVVSEHLSPWPLNGVAELTMLLADHRTRGYTVIFERGGWTILRRAPEADTSNDLSRFSR